MTRRGDGGTRAVHQALPPALRDAVDEFADHLARVRNRSAHTVRAYVTDVVSLLDHAARAGCAEVADVDLAVLRSWLARLRTAGAARSSLARRAASARVFSAWAHRRGLLPTDVGATLASPRAPRELPGVLRADQAAALVEAPIRPASGTPETTGHPAGAARTDEGDQPGTRPTSTPCSSGTGRCWNCSTAPGYGSARRAGSTSPTSTRRAAWSGCSARAGGSGPSRTVCRRNALWTTGYATAAPCWPRRAPVTPCSSAPAAGGSTRRRPAGSSAGTRTRPACPGPARTGCATRPPRTCWRGRGPARRAGNARPLLAGQHPDLHPRVGGPAARRVPPGAPPGLTGTDRS